MAKKRYSSEQIIVKLREAGGARCPSGEAVGGLPYKQQQIYRQMAA